MEKNTVVSELEVFKELKVKGYNYVVQFIKDNKKWGDPLAFKSADQVGPFLRSNPELKVEWNRNIDKHITLIEGGKDNE